MPNTKTYTMIKKYFNILFYLILSGFDTTTNNTASN